MAVDSVGLSPEPGSVAAASAAPAARAQTPPAMTSRRGARPPRSASHRRRAARRAARRAGRGLQARLGRRVRVGVGGGLLERRLAGVGRRRGAAAGDDPLATRRDALTDRGERRAAEVTGRGVTVRRVLGQRALDESGVLRRDVLRRRGRVEVRPHGRGIAVAHERRVAGERVNEHAAERVHVGTGVDALAADLLRRGVAERADPRAAAAEPAVGAERQLLGETEVGQVGVVLLAEQDVRRFDVAMDEAMAVGGVERPAELRHDAGRPLGSEAPLGADERAQVGPVDVAHDDEQHAVVLARVVDGEDVGVLDRGGGLGLGHEALAKVRVVGEARADDLQRDGSLEAELRRAVDDAHPAAPGQRVDAVVGEDVTWRELRHAVTSTRSGDRRAR